MMVIKLAGLSGGRNGFQCRKFLVRDYLLIFYLRPCLLGKFKPSEDMKTLKEETFGLKEGKDQPLYAYGNQISFFRLPVYPESKPKGTVQRNLLTKMFSFLFQRTVYFLATPTMLQQHLGWVQGQV